MGRQRQQQRRGNQRGASRARPKVRRNVTTGIVHIKSSFNNTIVSVSDQEGNVIAWESAGSLGFKGSRKSTPYAAQMTAESCANKAMDQGVRRVDIEVKGHGWGREMGAGSSPRVGPRPRGPSSRWASRSSASGTSRASRTTGAGRPRGAGGKVEMARYTGPRGRRDRRAGVMLSSMRKNPLGKKAYPPGGRGRGRRPAGGGNAPVDAEDPAGEEALPPRRARPGPPAADGVRDAPAREAEGALVLRGLREAVQAGLRQGDQDAGRLGREPAQADGASDGQRGLPDGLREQPPAVAPARRARPLPPQRPQAQHPLGHFEAGGRRDGQGEEPQPGAHSGRRRERGGGPGVAGGRPRQLHGQAAPHAGAGRDRHARRRAAHHRVLQPLTQFSLSRWFFDDVGHSTAPIQGGRRRGPARDVRRRAAAAAPA